MENRLGEARSCSAFAFTASLTVTVLGAILLWIYIRQFQINASGGTPVALLALRKDLAAGVALSEEMLVVHEVPESYVEARQVQASELPRILGVRTAIELKSNQTLAWTDLATTRRQQQSLSDRVPRGMRAIGIRRSSRGGFGELLADLLETVWVIAKRA